MFLRGMIQGFVSSENETNLHLRANGPPPRLIYNVRASPRRKNYRLPKPCVSAIICRTASSGENGSNGPLRLAGDSSHRRIGSGGQGLISISR